MEQQLSQTQKMETLGALASGIAHDFNNILTAIVGHTELASELVTAPHPAAESLQRIKQRQAVQEERLRVGQELEDRRSGADLDAKLRDAGILPGHASADDVLARLTAQDVKVVTPMIGQSVPASKDPA
jgi:signal transduction histidine kinase